MISINFGRCAKVITNEPVCQIAKEPHFNLTEICQRSRPESHEIFDFPKKFAMCAMAQPLKKDLAVACGISLF
jgi:hypothetical protein